LTSLICSHVARQTLGPDHLAGITHRRAPRACNIITAPSPPGGLHHAAGCHSPPPRGASSSRRQAPLRLQGLCCTIPPGGALPTTRCLARTVTPVTDLCPVRMAACSRRQAPYQQRIASDFWHLK